MLDFKRLTTPQGDGDLLIEPMASNWPRLIETTRRQQKNDPFTFAGVPATTVRQVTRTALFGDRADMPVIACGHQPAYVHPGVWAKDVVVRHMAHQLGTLGIHLVADNDALHSSAIQVPSIQPETLLSLSQVELGPAPTGAAYESQPACTKPEIENAYQDLNKLLAERFEESTIGDFLDGLRQGTDAGDLVQQYLKARTKIDTPLSANLQQVRISQAFGGPFVADLLLNPDRFVQAYNDALDEYRRQQNVRSQQRPLPDLGHVNGRIETALWIYRPLDRRQRLWVSHDGDDIHLYADQTHIGTLSANALRNDSETTLASLRPWVIRPRALTLTLWARLLVCDLFVHGIGGAKYDRITDGILQRYYQCEPTPFACVSATLRLPLPRQAVSADKLAAARQQARDLHFNPDRYLHNAPADLLDERRLLIRESDRLRKSRAPAYVRRQTFLDIRHVNARLLGSDTHIEREMTDRIEHLHHQLHSNKIADGREYFYALLPRKRLAQLVEQLVTACSQ